MTLINFGSLLLTLNIPAMSLELERVFSQAKRFYTDDRNRFGTDNFEAAMCLRQWAQQKLYDILQSMLNDMVRFGTDELYPSQ